MAVNVTGFKATSRIKNGKDGLSNSPGSKSQVKITGSNLADRLDVTVYYPAGSTTKVWTGKTSSTNAQKTLCRAKLDDIATTMQGRVRDGDTTVTVTVGDSTQQNFNVLTGPPLDGSYGIANNGTGGNNKWLAPSGTTGVNLAGGTSGPSWVFTIVQQGNCYTIQCQIGGSTYYLQWANSGSGTNVALVSAAGAGTNWMLDSDHIEAYPDSAVQPNSPILNGDVSTGTVSMLQAPNPNGSSWSLGTTGRPPPRT
jgi:hypothetical protein